MHTIKELQKIFTEHLAKQDFFSDPKELYEPIVYSMSMGGKKLRPVCLLAACELFGGDYRKALDPAVGIEMFHNFTLVHDDIMDNAHLRRGKETVFKKWNANIGILSGDTMFAIAFDYVMRIDDDLMRKAVSLFDKTAIEVCEGQQFDLNYETMPSVTISDYLNMIRLKTGVLVAASLKMGAIIARAEESQADAIYKFGLYTGLVFQLVDDLLDVFSDDNKFGKMRGGDIVCNKKTYLYIKGYELANEKEKQALDQLFNDKTITPEKKVIRIAKIWKKLGVPDAARAEIKQYHKEAIAYLDSLNIPKKYTTELRQFTDGLLDRTY
jgi:geranylgeranyl diphosphate synthase type II